jgi:phospho-N-acetylmuramoyl-pentapeptide-transferase
VSFLLVVPWGNLVIGELLRRNIGKHIRIDGPASHQVKSGTPTMGGLYILAGIGVITALLIIGGHTVALLPFLAMLGFGALGAYDDWQGLKDTQGVGWMARAKFPVQWGLALVLALLVYWLADAPTLVVPISGQVIGLGAWVIPLLAFLLVAASNAVNLTDGLDGLAGGTTAVAYGAYGVLAGAMGQRGLALFCFALAGVLAAFLWFNVHPARIFMGDTGSEALGAGLAVVAVLTGHWLLLPLIGIIFVAEALSSMLQVAYFKYTRRKYGEGRRILRMAPLHHHFEALGWSEVQVTLRFWIVGALVAAAGVALGIMA